VTSWWGWDGLRPTTRPEPCPMTLWLHGHRAPATISDVDNLNEIASADAWNRVSYGHW